MGATYGIIFGTIGGVFLVCLIIVICCCRCHRHRQRQVFGDPSKAKAAHGLAPGVIGVDIVW